MTRFATHPLFSRNSLLFLLGVPLLLLACSPKKTHDEWVAADRAELLRQAGSSRALLYRFFKLGFRAGTDTGSPEYKTYRQELAPGYPWQAADSSHGRFAVQVDHWSDRVNLLRKYVRLRPLVERSNEDRLPPLLSLPGSRWDSLPAAVRNSYEHAVLSMVLRPWPEVGRAAALYESSRIDARHLNPDFSVLLRFYQGYLFQQEGLYYLSEEALQANLQALEKSRGSLPLIDTVLGTTGSPGQVLAGFRALHHLLLASSHRHMANAEDRNRVDADLKAFRRETARSGLPPAVLERCLHYRDDPAAAESALATYLVLRFAGLARHELEAHAGGAALLERLGQIGSGYNRLRAYVDRDSLTVATARGVQEAERTSVRLWQKAKQAVK